MPIKHTSPNFESIEIKGAFQVDKNFVDRLHTIVDPYLDPPVETIYTLVMSNKHRYETNDVALLPFLQLNNPHILHRFLISIRDGDKRAVGVSFFYPESEAPAKVSVLNIDKGSELLFSLDRFMRGERAWYGWIFRVYSMVALAVIAPFFLSDPVYDLAAHPTRLTKIDFLLLGTVSVVVAFSITCRLFLFDRVSVMFGSEEARQVRRQTVRRWLFSTCFLALIAAIIGGIVSGYANGLFAHIADAPPSPLSHETQHK